MKHAIRLLCVVLLVCTLLASCDDDVTDALGDALSGGPTQLAVPTGIWIEEGSLIWNAVEFASGYTVSVDNRETACAETKFSLTGIADGDHTFMVKANGDGQSYATSAFSQPWTVRLTGGAITQTGTYGQFGDLSESYLGYGFDVIRSSVFSDKYVKLSNPIFKSEEILNQRLLRVDSKYSYIDEIDSKSMSDFSKKWNTNANASASYDGMFVSGSVELSAKFSGSSQSTKSIQYQCISITNQQFYIVLQSDLATYRSILTDAFLADLYSESVTPSALFDRYGTHFITSAVMGGKINSYYLHTSETEKDLSKSSVKAAAEVRAYKFKADAEVSADWREEMSNEGIEVKNTLEVIGGGDYAMLSPSDVAANYAAWEQSLDEEGSLIGIKDTGSLWAIWELIDPALDTGTYTWVDENGTPQSGTRSQQLQAYFQQYGIESYNALLKASGLPEIIAPTSIENIRVNGNEANGGEYIVFSGTENDISFGVLPQNAVGFTKGISLSTQCEYARVNTQNQLVIDANAPANTLLTVVLAAGGVRTQIQVRIKQTYTVEFMTRYPEFTIPTRRVVYGDVLIRPLVPSRPGYIFKGWFTDPGCTDEWDFLNDYVQSNMTLYAKWVEFNPTITFIDNVNGDSIDPVRIPYNTAYTPTAIPKLNGYVFAGYYSGPDMVREFDFTQLIKEDTAIYVKWNKNPTVRFVSSQAEFVKESVEIPYGTCFERPVTPTLSNYTFVGWYNDEAMLYAFDFTQPITVNTTIYVKWTPVNYTVYYDGNGGSATASQSLPYGSALLCPDVAPVKDNASFVGWYYDAAGQNKVDFATAKVTGEITLYAKWTEQQICTITFNSNGGDPVEALYVEKGSDTTIVLPEPTRSGYAFDGWYDENDNPVSNGVFDTDVSLKAKWTTNEYTIEYVLTNMVTTNNYTTRYTVESDIILPVVKLSDNTKRDYYELEGWFEDANFTTPFVNDLTSCPRNVTLYPKMYRAFCKVSFYSNGETISTKTLRCSEKYGELPTLTRTGYVFKGWNTSLLSVLGKWVTAETVVPEGENHTLYAVWTAIEYAVTFNANGGTLSLSEQSVHIPYGKNYDYCGGLPIPTRDGYAFAGWYTAASGGIKIENTTTMNTAGSHTLYAHWVVSKQTLTGVPSLLTTWKFGKCTLEAQSLKALGYNKVRITFSAESTHIGDSDRTGYNTTVKADNITIGTMLLWTEKGNGHTEAYIEVSIDDVISKNITIEWTMLPIIFTNPIITIEAIT